MLRPLVLPTYAKCSRGDFYVTLIILMSLPMYYATFL